MADRLAREKREPPDGGKGGLNHPAKGGQGGEQVHAASTPLMRLTYWRA